MARKKDNTVSTPTQVPVSSISPDEEVQEENAIFEHVMSNVLQKKPTDALYKALANSGIGDIWDLVTMDSEDVGILQPTDNTTLHLGDRNLLKWFLCFYHCHKEKFQLPSEWFHLTKQEFNEFRIQAEPGFLNKYSAATPPSQVLSSAMSGDSTTSDHKNFSSSLPAPRYSPAELFKKSIKKDPSLFPLLKDDRYHDQWHRTFETQARAQDLAEVLDPSYIPSGDNIELFKEKQKFMYAVLEQKVMTDQGKAYVRSHEKDFDAHQVYAKLKTYHLKSTRAKINSSTLLQYITSVKITDGDWKGSTHGFLLHWENQIRLYESQLDDKKEHFSPRVKRIMLENAVHPLDELRQVKVTADLEVVMSGKELTYQQYFDLLLAASSSYDAQHASNRRTKRTVYFHNQEAFGDEYIQFSWFFC